MSSAERKTLHPDGLPGERSQHRDLPDPEIDLTWEISLVESLKWTTEGISLLRHRPEKEDMEIQVILDYFFPRRKPVVEGRPYFEVEHEPGRLDTLSAGEWYDRLQDDGRIVYKSRGRDVLNLTLSHFAGPRVPVRPTFGIYCAQGSDELMVERSPVPVLAEQKTVYEKQAQRFRLFGHPTRLEHLQAYLEFNDHYQPFEVLPLMGLSAIAPAALELRRRDVIVPHTWTWSAETGLGKTLASKAYSEKLWGREHVSGAAFNSEYRLAAICDASCTTVVVDEAEQLTFRKLAPVLKSLAESGDVDKRGWVSGSGLSMKDYASRSVLNFTANSFLIENSSLLPRILAIHQDRSRADERQSKKEQLDRVADELQPVGLVLAEELVRSWPTIGDLRARVLAEERQLAARHTTAWADSRRARCWAVVLVGLDIWARAIERLGGRWRIPSLDELLEEVILPIDRDTYESKRSRIDEFRSWFQLYRVHHTTQVTEFSEARGHSRREHEAKGKGELWVEGTITVPALMEPDHRERVVPGVFVRMEMLELYNQEDRAPESKIPSLRDLARYGAEDARIPIDLVVEQGGKGQPRKATFPDAASSRQRAAFIPHDPFDSTR